MVRRRTPPHGRSLTRAFLGAIFVLSTLYACTDRGDVSAPGRSRVTSLSLAPRFNYVGGSSYIGEPINRIRLTARNQATDSILVTDVTDVDPDDQSWNVDLDLTLNGTIFVLVTVELINVTNGVEAVQWSGITAPIEVAPSTTQAPTAEVPMFPGPPSNLAVTAVVIAPDSAVLEEGTSANFNATIIGPPGSSAVWSVADPSIASITQNGALTALRPGTTTVTAAAGPQSDAVSVRVTQAIGSVVVAPDSQRVASIGGEATFTARVLDPRGAEIGGSAVLWSVADTAVARHVGGGRFVAQANGSTQVFANSVGRPAIRGSARMTVAQRAAVVQVTPAEATLTAVGATQPFAAAVRDANGNAMNLPVTWRTADAAIATIDAAGLATARAAGTTTISALVGSGADTAVGSAMLQVTQAPALIELIPDAATLTALGDTFLFVGLVKDANNNVLSNARLTWTSSNPSIADVNQNGRVTAVRNGSTSIIATLGNMTAGAGVTVQQAVAALALAPARDTVAVNDTVRFHATANDANANPVAAAAVTWTSSDTTIATIDANGLASGKRAGSVTLTASHGALVATGTLVVLGAPNLVASVATTPDAEWIQGDTVGAVLTVRNLGSAEAGPSRVRLMLIEDDGTQWSDDEVPDEDDELVVDIPAIPALGEYVTRVEGLELDTLDNWPETLRVRALADTTNAVVESNEDDNEFISNTKTIRHKVQSVEITPDAATITNIPGSHQLTAVVNGFEGRVLARTVTWTSAAPAVATVTNAGLVEAVSNGEALIIAEAEGRADTTVVTVNQSAASITILSDTIWFRTIGRTAQISAEVRDGAGQVVPNAAVSWQVLDTMGVVSVVGQTGGTATVTALKNGLTFVEAESGGRRTSLQVRVQQVAHTITINPNPASVQFGGTVQLSAAAADSSANGIANASFTWTSVDTAIAVVDGTGLVTGRAVGSTSVTASLGASGGSTAITVVAGPASQLRLISGNDQEAVVVQFVPDSLVVQVLDANNNPVEGVAVAWTPDSIGGEVVTSRGAGISAGVGARVMAAPPASLTNAQGIAKALWKLGHKAKQQTLQACAAEQCVTFTARGRPDRPHRGNKNTLADGQEVTVARIAPNAVEVIVIDQFENPVPDATVQWALSEGHGSLSSTSTTTDANGRAVVTWTMPRQRGSYRVDYSVRDALGELVDTGSFRAIAKPDKARNHVRSNDDQVVTVNQTAPNALRLVVSDTFDNAIDGAMVAWSLRDEHNGASLSAESSTTDSTGAATVSWTNVGKVAGPMFVDYTIFHDGEELSGSFKAHARAGKAKKANKNAATDSQTVIVARTAPNAVELTVLDEFDNPTRGTVDWRLESGHGTLASPSTSVIDTLTGKASATWQMPTLKGIYQVFFVVKDEAGDSVAGGSFKAHAKPDKPKNHARSNDDQVVTVNQTAPNALQLVVSDTFGNAIEGASVAWALRAGHVDGQLSTDSSTTDVNGATSVSWTNVGKAAGSVFVDYTVTHDGATLEGSFRARARAGKAAKGNKHAGDEQQVIVARIAPNALEVKVLDEYDNPTAGTVEWNLVGDGVGGLLSASSSAVDTLTGVATVQWEMPTVKGPYAVVFTVKDTAGNPVATDTFKATAKPDKPGRSSKAPGSDEQAVVVFTPLANALQVAITDTFDNPIEGVMVHWSLREPKSLDAQLMPAIATTDEDGMASASWLMGKKSGTFFVDYAVKDSAGNTLVAGSFRATGNPGTRAKVKGFRGAGADTTSSDALNDTIQLSAKTYDAYDNERNGDTITWSNANDKLDLFEGNKIVTRGNGIGQLTVTSGGFSRTFSINIDQKVKTLSMARNSEGAVDTLTALQLTRALSQTVQDRKNTSLAVSRYLSQVTWESLDPGIVTVTELADSVIVQSISDGVGRVVATADHDTTITDTVFVVVKQSAKPASTITITGVCTPNPEDPESVICPLPPGSVKTDSLVQLIAHGVDQRDIPLRKYKWSVSDGSAALIVGSSTDSILTIKGGLIGASFTVSVTDQRNSGLQTHMMMLIPTPPPGPRPLTPVGQSSTIIGDDPKKPAARPATAAPAPARSPPDIDRLE